MTSQEQKDKQYIEQVRKALIDARNSSEWESEKSFAINFGLNEAIWSRIKKGETEKVLSTDKWYEIGRVLQLQKDDSSWKTARTEVFIQIEEDILFCKENSECLVLVDECGIGKTYTAEYIRKSPDSKYQNIFYIDCSQCKSKQLLIRTLAKEIGVNNKGRFIDVKTNIKHQLNNRFIKPCVIWDEVGDLDYAAFLEIKELQNATKNKCGWYMMGADGLRTKINRGIENEKEGYKEIFSRFGDNFIKITPDDEVEQREFHTKLIKDILKSNLKDKTRVNEVISKSKIKGIGVPSLRRAQKLVKMLNIE